MDMLSNVRFRRNVERLCSKGARPVGEFLAEIGAERSIQTLIESKLARYAELDQTALAVTGSDCFPPTPLHEVKP